METKEETIRRVSEKIKEEDRQVFIDFMNERFDTVYGGYAEEWADRFRTEHPEEYMDTQSLDIYERLRGK